MAFLAGPLPLASAPQPSPTDGPVVRGRYLMGTRCTLAAYGEAAQVGPILDRALDRIAQLEQVFTTWRDDGELAQLNERLARGELCQEAGPNLPVSPTLAEGLRRAFDYAGKTGGAFDPTLGALLEAWGQKQGGRVPSPDQIARARQQIGLRCVEFNPRTRMLCARCTAVAIDLGAIGKGIALDEAVAVLRAAGLSNALLDFGGQVWALGNPPGKECWLVDLADPADRQRGVATLCLKDRSLATTSNSERAFEHDGKRYGHVLDPRSGLPVAGETQLSVIATTGTEADALSTAFFVDPQLIRSFTGLDSQVGVIRITPQSQDGWQIQTAGDVARWIVASPPLPEP